MSSDRNNLSFQSNAQIDIRRPDNRLSISVTLGGKMHKWNNICVMWYVKFYVIYTLADSMSQPLSSAELFAHLNHFATEGNFYTAIFNEVSKVSRNCFYFA